MGTALLLEPVGLKLPMGQKVIKAKEYKAYCDAREIIKRAEEKAAQIEEDAKVAFEEEKKRGFEKGLAEGNDKIAEKMIDTIGKTIDYFEGVEQALVDVVIVAMKKILVSYEDTKLVKQIVKSALQVVRNQKHITLRVHPDVKDIVQDNLGEIASSSPTIGIIEVVGDTRVDRDGCIVDCDMGIVEASLSSQLKILEEAMHSSLGKGKKPSAVTAKPVTKATSKAKPAKKPTKKAEPKAEPKEEEPKDKK